MNEENRNINGWIFNKLYVRKSDCMQVWRAKKHGVIIEGIKADILNTIRDLEGDKEWQKDV